MDNISKFLKHNSKFQRLAGPLRAAQICDTARGLADGRFDVLSFKDGLITLRVSSAPAAADLQLQSQKIINSINEKVGQKFVQRIRWKIS